MYHRWNIAQRIYLFFDKKKKLNYFIINNFGKIFMQKIVYNIFLVKKNKL